MIQMIPRVLCLNRLLAIHSRKKFRLSVCIQGKPCVFFLFMCTKDLKVFSNSIGEFISGVRRYYSGRRNKVNRWAIQISQVVTGNSKRNSIGGLIRISHVVAGTAEDEPPIAFHLDPAMQTESCCSLGIGSLDNWTEATWASESRNECPSTSVNHVLCSDEKVITRTAVTSVNHTKSSDISESVQRWKVNHILNPQSQEWITRKPEWIWLVSLVQKFPDQDK